MSFIKKGLSFASLGLSTRNTIPLNPFFHSDRPLIMAHRGNSVSFPENSLESLKDAVSLNVDVLEVDARMTRDNDLVVFHDETVDRVTNGKGKISDFLLDELKELELGYNFSPDGRTFPFRGKKLRILTVNELFEHFPDQRINIDIKNDDISAADSLGSLIRSHGMDEHVFVASFHQRIIDHFRKHYPHVLTAAGPNDIRSFIKAMKLRYLRFKRLNYAGFQVPIKYGDYTIITPGFIRGAHKKGIKVMVWTINERKTMVELLKMGVDGIFTDTPALLVEVVNELF
ncbi:MAG: glycerophosphodiester phosphodiesterase [Candidatus Hodarchaeales archaeon]